MCGCYDIIKIMTDDILEEKEKLLIEFFTSKKELFIKVSGIIKPEYFTTPLDGVVEFIMSYFFKYHNPPSFDVIKAETGIKLIERHVLEHEMDYVIEEIELHCKNQAMRLAILKSVDHLEKSDYGAIEQKVREALLVSIDKDMGLNLFNNPKTTLLQMQEKIDSRSIGWPSMDMVTDNIKRGEIFIFAGTSGAGKSLTMINIANNLAKDGLNCLYISLELSEELNAKRLYSMISDIPPKEIFDNIDGVAESLKQNSENYGSFYIKKMPVDSTSNDIRSYLLEYEIQFRHKPDVICVDYLDIMKPNTKIDGGGVFDKDKAITEQLREIFVDFNVYGFSLSQLNRESVDTSFKSQSHIAGGISKANTADVVVAISRTQEQIDKDEIEYQFLKLRNAGLVTYPVTLFLNPKNLMITDRTSTKRLMPNATNETAKNRLQEIIGKGKCG
jgi:Straboviridae DNA replication helicase